MQSIEARILNRPHQQTCTILHVVSDFFRGTSMRMSICIITLRPGASDAAVIDDGRGGSAAHPSIDFEGIRGAQTV